MRIIALDSSGLVASAAIVEDDTVLAEYNVQYKKKHSQTLLPMLEDIVKMTEFDMNTVDALAVVAGPGSFTGLRIGSATVKGLGLVLGKKIAAVPTVDALAYNAYGCGDIVCPIMDARRNQVYTGIYTFERNVEHGMDLNVIMPQCTANFPELVSKLNEIGRPVCFLGDGVPVFLGKIKGEDSGLKVPYYFAPAGHNRQRAVCVALAAEQYVREGRLETAEEHAPIYLRPSQAEREREDKITEEKNKSAEEKNNSAEEKNKSAEREIKLEKADSVEVLAAKQSVNALK